MFYVWLEMLPSEPFFSIRTFLVLETCRSLQSILLKAEALLVVFLWHGRLYGPTGDCTK